MSWCNCGIISCACARARPRLLMDGIPNPLSALTSPMGEGDRLVPCELAVNGDDADKRSVRSVGAKLWC